MLECNIRKSQSPWVLPNQFFGFGQLIQFCHFTERNAFAGIQFQRVQSNWPIQNAIINARVTRKDYVVDTLPSTFLKLA